MFQTYHKIHLLVICSWAFVGLVHQLSCSFAGFKFGACLIEPGLWEGVSLNFPRSQYCAIAQRPPRARLVTALRVSKNPDAHLSPCMYRCLG